MYFWQFYLPQYGINMLSTNFTFIPFERLSRWQSACFPVNRAIISFSCCQMFKAKIVIFHACVVKLWSNSHILGTLRTQSDSSSISWESHNFWVRGICIQVPHVWSGAWCVVQSLRGGFNTRRKHLESCYKFLVNRCTQNFEGRDDIAWWSVAWELLGDSLCDFRRATYFMPQFPHLYNEDNSTFFKAVRNRWNSAWNWAH